MNDRMEGEYIEAESDGTDLHFTSFSRVEENLAMYKMYSPAPDCIFRSSGICKWQLSTK